MDGAGVEGVVDVQLQLQAVAVAAAVAAEAVFRLGHTKAFWQGHTKGFRQLARSHKSPAYPPLPAYLSPPP